jgi:hypothetical protein
MADEPLARIRGDPAQLATTVEFAALRSGDPTAHDVMFTRLHPDRIETPASSPDASQVSYCTGKATMYDDLRLFVEPPVDALFDIDQVLSWLDWLGGVDEPVSTTFEGDPATGVTERLVHEAGDTEVIVPCEGDWGYEEISLSLPDHFRDGRFLDADGEPLPTRIRTHTDELARLVRAADMAGSDGEYAFAVEDGDLRFVVDGPDGLLARSRLAAEVQGPDVRTTVGEDFQSVVSGLVGPVELQVGPGKPLAIFQFHDDYTLRFVVYPD